MTFQIKNAKTNNIAPWTQTDLNAQIALGNFPPGTTINDIPLSSDWNNPLVVSGALGIANGGTGATIATDAISNLISGLTYDDPNNHSGYASAYVAYYDVGEGTSYSIDLQTVVNFILSQVVVTPGGSNGNIQWNNSGSLDGASATTYSTSGTHLLITSQATTNVVLALKDSSGTQTGNTFEIRKTSGTPYIYFGPTTPYITIKDNNSIFELNNNNFRNRFDFDTAGYYRFETNRDLYGMSGTAGVRMRECAVAASSTSLNFYTNGGFSGGVSTVGTLAMTLDASQNALMYASVKCQTLATGLSLKEGSNGWSGSVALTSGVATVTITGIGASTHRVFVTRATGAGTLASAGYTATITSNTLTITAQLTTGTTQTLDTSTINYVITGIT